MSEAALIIGAGPAGSSSALNLLKAGLKPTIIETESFPRFHIGESLTTQCTDALNLLGLQDELEKLNAPGKKGVRIFSNHPENSFYVGAGDAWQVERARFDQMLLENAKSRGAEIINGRVTRLKWDENQWTLKVKRTHGRIENLKSRFVVDASGQQRFSHRQGVFPNLSAGNYARQIAFFSQFKHIDKLKDDNADTLIFHRESHEWCWMIPLSDSITSIGLVIPVEQFKAQKLPAEEFIEKKLSHFSKPFERRFNSAIRTAPVRTISNYSYQIDHYANRGLYCVGDSHRFIDPIFSFGVEFAVMEAHYMAKAVKRCLDSDFSNWEQQENQYIQVTSQAQDIISDLLAYFWAHPWGFANMAHFRHKDEFLEIFAGRIYEVEAGTGLTKMRMAMA